ncbi:MAG: ATP-dependent Clp protease ATP-binding subunit [Clostridiaceae bacterium]|nr:ATP-dependent Clp protease ATP-binding subunit [Clostridiaceae bacterium]
MLCKKCNKNIAVVFVTKVEGSTQKNEGYCLTCAKELGIEPLNDIIRQMGINEQQFDELNKGIMENLPEVTQDKLQQMMPMMKNMFADSDKDDSNENKKETKTKTANKPERKKAIEQFGTNLTAKAHNNEIDRVIGRETEITRVTQILNRRTKNNPVLIGEPGVGKTAIAEGLAVRIAEKNVPNKLLNKEIYLLDFAAIVAGTQFRGQFEARVKAIIEEAKALGNVIFVIDELHNIVAAGDAEGAMGAANILKPALAKGDIQVIGATTLNEYRKHIEKDSALERRFQQVIVEEPSVEETIEIIKGIKDYYEKHHTIIITDEIIKTATILSKRYISDRFLPDKAIDVIDEAGARANLNNYKLTELENLKNELQQVQRQKENAASADSIEEYQKAANLKINECRLIEEIKKLEKECVPTYLTTEDVAAIIEMWTKIPVKRITELETEKLITLEQRLHKRLIGQDDAVNAVARAIRISRAGISPKKRPVSFIFVGPTGVGKTELVRTLAKELFDDEQALIRLDMSEYTEKHSVSKIIGSPPGYVGYDEAGQLTEKVRRKPYSIILLDEIEKAHADIFNLLLQLFDEGRLTDSHGKVVNFENCVIIMTSNAGSDLNSNTMGFVSSHAEGIRAKVDTALKQIFRPEFLNRIDDIIIFTDLSKPQLLDICSLMLDDLAKGTAEKGITLKFTGELKEYVVKKGYNNKYGARPMRRIITKEIEAVISEMLITNKIKAGSCITITVANDDVIVVAHEVDNVPDNPSERTDNNG